MPSANLRSGLVALGAISSAIALPHPVQAPIAADNSDPALFSTPKTVPGSNYLGNHIPRALDNDETINMVPWPHTTKAPRSVPLLPSFLDERSFGSDCVADGHCDACDPVNLAQLVARSLDEVNVADVFPSLSTRDSKPDSPFSLPDVFYVSERPSNICSLKVKDIFPTKKPFLDVGFMDDYALSKWAKTIHFAHSPGVRMAAFSSVIECPSMTYGVRCSGDFLGYLTGIDLKCKDKDLFTYGCIPLITNEWSVECIRPIHSDEDDEESYEAPKDGRSSNEELCRDIDNKSADVGSSPEVADLEQLSQLIQSAIGTSNQPTSGRRDVIPAYPPSHEIRPGHSYGPEHHFHGHEAHFPPSPCEETHALSGNEHHKPENHDAHVPKGPSHIVVFDWESCKPWEGPTYDFNFDCDVAIADGKMSVFIQPNQEHDTAAAFTEYVKNPTTGAVTCTGAFLGYATQGCHEIPRAFALPIKCLRPVPRGWLDHGKEEPCGSDGCSHCDSGGDKDCSDDGKHCSEDHNCCDHHDCPEHHDCSEAHDCCEGHDCCEHHDCCEDHDCREHHDCCEHHDCREHHDCCEDHDCREHHDCCEDHDFPDHQDRPGHHENPGLYDGPDEDCHLADDDKHCHLGGSEAHRHGSIDPHHR